MKSKEPTTENFVDIGFVLGTGKKENKSILEYHLSSYNLSRLLLLTDSC
jgi:hypothetical protein